MEIRKQACATSFEPFLDQRSCKPKWCSSAAELVFNEMGGFPPNVLKYIRFTCFGLGVRRLKCFTTLCWNKLIIRAHPFYNKREWYAYVDIKWKVIIETKSLAIIVQAKYTCL